MKKKLGITKTLTMFTALTLLVMGMGGCSSTQTPNTSTPSEGTLTAAETSTQASTISSSENTAPAASDFVIDAYGELDPQVSAQQIIADKKGFFEEQGLKVNNHLMTGPSENAPLVASGTAGICFGSVYNNIAVAANGVKVKVLAPTANAGGTQSVIARKGLELTSAKDLEGKKIGMTSGAGVLIAIRNMCEELGVDINKIQFVNLQASEQLAALERGDIDAMAVWEPWVGKAIDMGGTLLFSGTEANLPEKKGPVHWIDFYMTVQATEDFYANYPEETKKFLAALQKATDYINENREEAAKIIAEEINISPEDCLRIMGNNVYSMSFDNQFVTGANKMAEFMVDMENISAVPEFNSYGFLEALAAVDASLVTAK